MQVDIEQAAEALTGLKQTMLEFSPDQLTVMTNSMHRFADSVRASTDALTGFNDAQQGFNNLVNALTAPSAASYALEQQALAALLPNMRDYVSVSGLKIQSARELNTVLREQGELLSWQTDQMRQQTEHVYQSARVNNLVDPLEFTFYDAATLAAKFLVNERGIFCEPFDGKLSIKACKSIKKCVYTGVSLCAVWYWAGQRFWRIPGGELVQLWYLAPKALCIPYKPKPEAQNMVNYYKASDATMTEKSRMARWIVARINDRHNSPHTAFRPPYVEVYADPFQP